MQTTNDDAKLLKDRRSRAKAMSESVLRQDAEELVMLLETCNGDIDMFLRTFHTNLEQETTIQFQIEMLLNREENREWRKRWHEAIAAYKRIRLARAQRTALDVISKITPIERTSKYFKDVQAHAKLLLSADLTAQTHRAKKQVEKQIIQEDDEPDELDSMIQEMT